MKRILIVWMTIVFGCSSICAQRFTDNLDRGLVVVQTGSNKNASTSNLITWRRLADEYFNVTYNLYKNGENIVSNLTSTCYEDKNQGLPGSKYEVAAVVNGVEQNKCSEMKAWNWYAFSGRYAGYIDVPMSPVYDRDGNLLSDEYSITYETTKDNQTIVVTETVKRYSPNDATFADLDGDGDLEMIIKRLNTYDAGIYEEYINPSTGLSATKNIYLPSTKQYVVIDAYDVDWETGSETSLMWRIDCGPNMVSANSTEINFIVYDWDEDGKAEVVLRGADNMIVYGSDGSTEKYRIGRSDVNTRSAGSEWTHEGDEYLIYMDGETGDKYQLLAYPLPRYEQGETNLYTAWGDDYGHRSSKYFFGAPFLDGRHASLFLGRGIYTRHKMMAMDLDKTNHNWNIRWTWACNDANSPWYGNGYHNYIIADVDEDGRDEIVYGSMVIDDNGKGLSTTGFEHGDAQHVSDFNPWRKGLEYFGCLEDNPYWGNNYRDATTSEVLYKYCSKPTAEEMRANPKAGDDGRCMMGNFSSTIPGCIGRSVNSQIISSVTNDVVAAAPTNNNDAFYWGHLNFRIYWDGDLGSEILDSPGTAREAAIWDYENGRIFVSEGCNLNQGSKNNPCFQGDIIGDWREEIVVRCGSNVRIYTTGVNTNYSLPCLWYDHQYRQAMLWQMMAYNQPPHLSYFMGELEGYTTAPPPYSMRNRTEIAHGSVISSTHNGMQIIACETNDMSINVVDGASPWVFYDNAASWVQGTDVNGTTGTKVKDTWNGTTGDGTKGVRNLPAINYAYYTHKVTGSAFTGGMNLVKQGDGTLVLPDVTETYTGKTDIWAGTVEFNGTFASSPVWMNRFTTFNTDGGSFLGGLTMEYNATLNVGGETAQTISTVTVSDLMLKYGARVVMDVNSVSDARMNDQLNLTNLTIDNKNWENGPKYSAPVFEINASSALTDGRYPIGTVNGMVTGRLARVVIEGNNVPDGAFLAVYDNILYLIIGEEPNSLDDPVITLANMTSSDGGYYYYPTVSITDPNLGLETTLTGTFTNASGVTSALNGTLYSQNYENETNASSWTNKDGGGTLELVTNDATFGNYIHHSITERNRSAYTLFSVDLTNESRYHLEFDTRIRAGNMADRSVTDLVVMTTDATIPTERNVGYDFDDYGNAVGSNYLLRLKAADSQVFTINDGTETVSLNASKWYHIELEVDVTSKTVSYTICEYGSTTPVVSGTFTVPSTSCFPKGIFILDGRGSGDSNFDNIKIYTTLPDSYTFTEPGTLEVTVSAEGCGTASAEYEVPKPYAIYYESSAYNEIDAADVYSTLGDKWKDTNFKDRWANWNKYNSTYYGNNYVFVARDKWSDNYVDNDSVLTVADTRNLHLVEGFGLGRNKTNADLTFSATDLGDETTVIYYKIDDSAGYENINYNEGYTYANADGSWSIDVSTNHTFCKLIAWVPIDEEYSELSEAAPTGSGNGNVAMRRTFSSITNGSGWNTLVVPFDMNDRQILTSFGPGTQVAQFVGSTANSLIFNADTREIHANEPVLIRVGDVHANNFYVFAGVTRNVDDTPTITSNYFDFVGSYLNSGDVKFPANSYFYNAANGNVLNRVAENNRITFKGYRAYFSAHPGVDVKQILLSFEDAEALGIDVMKLQQKPVDVYTVSGLLIRRNATTLDGLPRGLYIVGKKKVVIN